MLSEEGLYSCGLGAVQSGTDAESYGSLSLDSLNSCPKKWSSEGPPEAVEAEPPRAGPSVPSHFAGEPLHVARSNWHKQVLRGKWSLLCEIGLSLTGFTPPMIPHHHTCF